MKSLTDMFNDRVGLTPIQAAQDELEYLTEREGIRIYDGLQDEATAVTEAEKDLERLEGREHIQESFELDF